LCFVLIGGLKNRRPIRLSQELRSLQAARARAVNNVVEIKERGKNTGLASVTTEESAPR